MAGKKIAIDLDPQGSLHFTRTIKVPTGDGKPLSVDFDFLFRDRLQMAELLEKWDASVEQSRDKAKAIVDATAEGTTSMRDIVAATRDGIDGDVETLLDFLTGWNLTVEFNAENLGKFVRRYPGAPLALVRDYREGMTQGRLGN